MSSDETRITLAKLLLAITDAIIIYGDKRRVCMFGPCGDCLEGKIKITKYDDELNGDLFFDEDKKGE